MCNFVIGECLAIRQLQMVNLSHEIDLQEVSGIRSV